MKKILLFVALALFAWNAEAQCESVQLEVETYAVHTGMVGTIDLTGYTTYRVYATTPNDDDFVSAVAGLGTDPALFTFSGDLFQSVFGGATVEQINDALFETFPSLEFDSFVTIGKTSVNSEGGSISTAVDPDSPWTDAFENGDDIYMGGLIGGLWFQVNSPEATNAISGPDFKVLIAQFTTNAPFGILCNIQVFPHGESADAAYTCNGVEYGVYGCTDSSADNYDSTAQWDDGLCTYGCQLTLDSLVVTNPTCGGMDDASFIAYVSGGQGEVHYSLDEGMPLLNNSFGGLENGTYSLHIEDDAESCFIDEEVIVYTAPFEIEISLLQDMSCHDVCDALITGTSSGAQGMPMFGLSDTVSSQLLCFPDFISLCEGEYTAYGHDEMGCLSMSNTIMVTNPGALNINVSGSPADATCFDSEDGILAMGSFGGVPPVMYSVDGGMNFDQTNVINLAGGEYVIYGQDDNGCAAEDSVLVTVGAPDPVMLDLTVMNAPCNGDTIGGTVTAMATGGNGGFTYSFGDTLNFTSMNEWMQLEDGDFTVYTMDNEGCDGMAMTSVAQPDAFTISLDPTDISCNGETDGVIMAMGTGGTEDYTFSINCVDFDDNDEFEGLAAGDYTICAMDENGCETSMDASIAEPDAMTLTIDSAVEDSGAGDGAIDITSGGGTGDHEYDWTGPNGFSSSDEDIDGLEAGDYTVCVTDENDCEICEDVTVLVGINELANGVNFSVTPNPNNGQFNINLSGMNNEKVSYTITDAVGRIVVAEEISTTNTSFSQEVNISNVANGVYNLTITVGQYASTAKIVKQF